MAHSKQQPSLDRLVAAVRQRLQDTAWQQILEAFLPTGVADNTQIQRATGFLEGPIVIPSFILQELRHIADSAESHRRERGRRGLDVLNRLKADPDTEVIIYDDPHPPKEHMEVDARLVSIAARTRATVVRASIAVIVIPASPSPASPGRTRAARRAAASGTARSIQIAGRAPLSVSTVPCHSVHSGLRPGRRSNLPPATGGAGGSPSTAPPSRA